MLRPIPLLRYLAVVKSKGFAGADVMRGTGLDVREFSDPEYLIDAGQYCRVVENMIELTGGEGLGLDIGLERDVKDFGILGYAALSCRSVRHSVEEFWARYGDALGMMSKISIRRGNAESVTLDIIAAAVSPLAHRFFVEEALCLLLKVGAQVNGHSTRFLDLRVGYPAPRYHQRYRDIFGCEVAFDAKSTRVTVQRAWFDMSLNTSNPELVQMFKEHLEQLENTIETSNPLSARLHQLFQRRSTDLPRLDDAARELGFSPRSLRRALHAQGRSYRKMLESFRMEMTLDSLRSGTIAAKTVGRQAGFDDVNAFRRAFKRWTGGSVTQYLAQHATPIPTVDRAAPGAAPSNSSSAG